MPGASTLSSGRRWPRSGSTFEVSGAIEVLQRNARSRPVEGAQLAVQGEGGERGAELPAAEADIGHDRIGQQVLVDPAAVRPDVAHGPGDDGGDADMTRAIHRQGIEELVPAEGGEHMAPVAIFGATPVAEGSSPGGERTGCFQVIGQAPRGWRLGDIQPLAVR